MKSQRQQIEDFKKDPQHGKALLEFCDAAIRLLDGWDDDHPTNEDYPESFDSFDEMVAQIISWAAKA